MLGRIWVFFVACALAVFARPLTASGQETVAYASLSGRVVDQIGAPIAGTIVSVRQVDTNVLSNAVTDRDGRFRFSYLRPGPYDLDVHVESFSPFTRRLTLTVGAAFDLPIALSVAGVDASVVVHADAPVLETARSQIAATVTRPEVDAVPLNGRSFLDLALLIPGISPTNVGGGTQLFAETSAVPGVGLSVSSQRNLSNNFMVDGLSANDDAAALSGISFSVDAVDQFQVVTSGGQAELGRALGGHINIATRSGTNVWRADADAFFRDDRLNAANALSGSKLPMHQNQYSASVGGPLTHDKTFLFANVEQRLLDQSGLVTIGGATVDAINARLSAIGYGGPLLSTGVYSNPIDTAHGLVKIDRHFSAADHFSVRYSAYGVSSEHSRAAGGTSAVSASAGLENLDQTVAFGNVWILSSKTVLETRGQYAHSDLNAPPADPIGPAVSISGVAAFGTSSGSPTARLNSLYQIVNNLSHQSGPHSLRAGVDVLFNDDTITYPRSSRGSYTFANLSNFLAGIYNTAGFTQTFGTSVVSQANPNVGLYVQDEWRPRSRLTVNAGLRYDLQFLQTIDTDTNNLSPRLGLVWQPFSSQRAVVRGSIGRFFDRVPLRAVANALLSAGNSIDLGALRQASVTLSPGQTGAPIFPNILDALVPSTTLVNFTTMDRHMRNASADQASVEIERQIGRATTISASYQHLRGRDLIMQINQNVPACAVSGGNNGCRPNSAYANNNQYSAAGRSVYDGLQISFVQRPTAWGSYRVSYTLSKSMNDVGEAFFNAPIDPFDPSKDWGRSDDDQRHRLTVSGAVAGPATGGTIWRAIARRFQLSGMLQYYSAPPFNVTTGANTIQGTAARPTVDGAFIARNAGIGSDFSTVSLRLSRTFVIRGRAQVDGLLEAFNVFNRRNDVARVTVFGTGAYPSNPAANFGQVTVVGDPRAIQLGLRFRY